MGIFGKSATQKRIDELLAEVARTGVMLTNEIEHSEMLKSQLRAADQRLLTSQADLAAANAKIARMTGGLIPGGPKAKAKREATTGSAAVRAAMEGV